MPSRFERYTTHHTSRRLDGWDYTQSAVYFVTICTNDRVCLFGTVDEGRVTLNRYGRIVVEEWRRSETIRDEVTLDAFVVMPNHVHGILWIRPDLANSSHAATRDDDGRAERGAPARDGGATDDDGRVERGDPAGVTDDADPVERSVTARRDASAADHVGGEDDPVRRDVSDGDTSSARQFGRPRAGSLGTIVGAVKSAVTRRINDDRGTPGASVWQRNYHERIIRNERHLHAARRYIRDNPAKWHEDRLRRGG